MTILYGKKILVVDDEPLLREILVALIKEEGGEAVEATDGDEALLYFKDQVFDAVVSDIRMPNMSGIELAAAIRKINPIFPVIFLITGEANLPKRSAEDLKVSAIVAKPCDIFLLLDNLVKAMTSLSTQAIFKK